MEIAPIETPASSSSTDGEAGACLPDLSAETARTPRKRLAWNPSLVDSTGPPSALELWEWQNPQELASIFVPHEEIELARLEARVERCQDPRRSALRRRGRESTEGYGSARHAIAAAAAASGGAPAVAAPAVDAMTLPAADSMTPAASSHTAGASSHALPAGLCLQRGGMGTSASASSSSSALTRPGHGHGSVGINPVGINPTSYHMPAATGAAAAYAAAANAAAAARARAASAKAAAVAAHPCISPACSAAAGSAPLNVGGAVMASAAVPTAASHNLCLVRGAGLVGNGSSSSSLGPDAAVGGAVNPRNPRGLTMSQRVAMLQSQGILHLPPRATP